MFLGRATILALCAIRGCQCVLPWGSKYSKVGDIFIFWAPYVISVIYILGSLYRVTEIGTRRRRPGTCSFSRLLRG